MLDFGVESGVQFDVSAKGGILFGNEFDLELVECVPHGDGLMNKNKISIFCLESF
jgi:hypothetical protein